MAWRKPTRNTSTSIAFDGYRSDVGGCAARGVGERAMLPPPLKQRPPAREARAQPSLGRGG